MKENKEARFQDYQFDRELGGKRGKEELLKVASPEDLEDFRGFLSGFQIKRFRTGYRRELPEWVRSKVGVQKVLLAAFPKLNESLSQRRRAGKWLRVITLFYLQNWSEAQVAAEINESVCRVRHHIAHIDNVANGLTALGFPRRRKPSK